MATQRRNNRLPAQADALFAGLAREYAEADDTAWDDLRAHLDDRIALIAGGSLNRRAALLAEFERVREKTVANRTVRRTVGALRADAATLLRVRSDGLEEWQVTASTGETARVLVPTDPSLPAETLRVVRAAQLSGTCPGCGRTAELVGSFIEVPHNSRCPGRGVL